ncbi:sporulation protein YunB [Ruminococcus sp.]|uniref:sporulation protein YunB n=1 Tax=Ruminococcus sp. TaxID=41978 RepID=UPI0025E6E573|nr:sporulation protein YunB [Ruminococcus sp.]MBQ8967942.1 sporulation protein YunB [Ruminococcus sp.]
MSRRHTSKKCKLSYILLIIIILMIAAAAAAACEIGEHLAEIAEYRGRAAATEIVTAAVDRTMSRCKDEKLYQLVCDEKGRVLSAELNAASANRLKNILTEEIEHGLEKLGEEGIAIPVGTLLGIPVFTGKGAAFELGVQQLGAVTARLSSDLQSAGINQTRLTVNVTVTVSIRAILPDGHNDITVTEEHIISDNMIVGEVPHTYLAEHTCIPQEDVV